MLTDKQIVKCLISVSDPMEVQRAGLAPVIAEFARAIEALVRAECVPPGHVAVPLEPTRDQIMAAHDGPLCAGEYKLTADTEAFLIEMYTAMLAAAPGIAAPQGEQQ